MNGGFFGGFALALGAVLIWGAQFPIAKAAFALVDPFHATAFRYAVPALVLAVMLVVREGVRALHTDGRGRAILAIGLIGMCGSPMLVFGGLQYTRPEIVATIIASQPAMAAVFEWLVHRRRPHAFTLVCVAVAFLGVLTILTRWDPALAPHGNEIVGNLMALVGALCWVVYTLASAQRGDWSTLRFTTLTMIPGAAGNFLVVAVLVATGVFVTPPLDVWLDVGWHIAYFTLGGVLLAMMMWNAGTRRVGALNAMLLSNLVPVVTFAIRYVQGYRFVPLELLGAALVIGALIANNIYLRRLYSSRP